MTDQHTMSAPGSNLTAEEKAKATGTEFHTHMTTDGAPGSHSAIFGLTPSGETKNAGAGLGSGVEGTSGHAGANASKPTVTSGTADDDVTSSSKTGGVSDGSDSNAPIGAGSSMVGPSQGTGTVGVDA